MFANFVQKNDDAWDETDNESILVEILDFADIYVDDIALAYKWANSFIELGVKRAARDVNGHKIFATMTGGGSTAYFVGRKQNIIDKLQAIIETGK